MDPHNFFSSLVRLVDWVLETASSLKGRRVTITGGSGALGKALIEQLEKQRVKSVRQMKYGVDWSVDDCSAFGPVLFDTDILILAHGSKNGDSALSANFHSSIAIIEAFEAARSHSKLGLFPEVWYIGSESEVHGSWSSNTDDYVSSKRAFVPFAKAYYDDESFIYRHIVPAAFTSGMGQGLVSARWVARVAVWCISRGARYVPVIYTGFAFANYFRFMYWVQPKVISKSRFKL